MLVSSTAASNDAASPTTHQGSSVSDLQHVHRDMEKFLNMHTASLEAWRSKYIPLVQQLYEKHMYLSELESDLAMRTNSLQQNVNQINALQLQHLAKQLNETVHMELKTRQSVANDDTQQPEVPLSGITESAMKEMIAGDVILDTAEASLKQWIVTVVEKDVMQARVAAATAPQNKTRTNNNDAKRHKCLTPSDGAQLVQQSLLEHIAPTTASTSKTGPVNHLATAIVVHEWTSDTYTAPPTDQDLLGHASWRKYIPQDWETRWLPHGWHQWNMAMPDALVRSLGIDGAATLPPESILDSNVHPGACWPMKGRKGFVTLRLAEPVVFESITIEHQAMAKVTGSETAPRHFEIIGYPPSSSDSWGFDLTQGKLLTAFEFDPIKSSSETFTTTSATAVHHEDDADSLGGGGSCSAVKPSCDGAPKEQDEEKGFLIAGIKINIVGNWGNPDYTCFYRATLQGSTI